MRALLASTVPVLTLAAAAPLSAQTTLQPEVGVDQVFDFAGRGDGGGTDIYTQVRGSLYAAATNDRFRGTFSGTVSHKIKEQGEIFDPTRLDLVARMNAELLREFLFLDAGAVATTLVEDTRGTISADPNANNDNTEQAYNFFVEPSLQRRVSGALVVDASYRLAATFPDSGNDPFANFDPNELFIANLSDTVSHTVQAGVGNSAGNSRFRWNLRGYGDLTKIDVLDQKLKQANGIFDVEYRINRSVSLLGSAGYEEIENMQDNILRDPNTGEPILDPDGNIQIDPSDPRVISYEQNGFIWDVGLRYSPNERFDVSGRFGERYGGTTGSFNLLWRARQGLTLTANYAESLDTTGRLLTTFVDGVPISSTRVNSRYTVGFNGCAIGVISGTSTCIGGLTQSVTSAVFLTESFDIVAELGRNETRVLFSGFVNSRRYLNFDAADIPNIDPDIVNATDDAAGVTATVRRDIGARGTGSIGVYYTRYDYGLEDGRTDNYIGGSLRYDYAVRGEIGAYAQVFVSRRTSNTQEDETDASLSFGATYKF